MPKVLTYIAQAAPVSCIFSLFCAYQSLTSHKATIELLRTADLDPFIDLLVLLDLARHDTVSSPCRSEGCSSVLQPLRDATVCYGFTLGSAVARCVAKTNAIAYRSLIGTQTLRGRATGHSTRLRDGIDVSSQCHDQKRRVLGQEHLLAYLLGWRGFHTSVRAAAAFNAPYLRYSSKPRYDSPRSLGFRSTDVSAFFISRQRKLRFPARTRESLGNLSFLVSLSPSTIDIDTTS